MLRKLRTRIVIGIALAALAMALVAAAVSLGARRVVRSNVWVDHTHKVLGSIERLYSAVKAAEAAQRGYLLTGQVEFEQEFFAAIPQARDEAAAVAREVSDNPAQVARAAQMSDLVEKRLQTATVVAQIFRDKGFDAARDALINGQGPALMRQIDATHAAMVRAEQLLLEGRTAHSSADATWLQRFTFLGLATSLIVLILVARQMLRETSWRARAEARTAEANVQLQERVEELHLHGEQTREMSRYAGMLQSCRNLQEAIDVTRDAAQRMLPELGGSVYLLRASQDLVERLGSWGVHAITSHELLPPPDCWALRRGQTYEVSDIHRATACAHVKAPAASDAASYLCIPLVAHADTMGFMHFSGPGNLAVTRREVAVSIAEQLSLALSNLRLQESLRVQSIRDPLTGLFNRRYLEESLERELTRCSRRGLPLSVLMLDLDHFKRFNDSHGHDGGDALLSQAGRVLQALCRNEDIACRYGGEEFTLILPEMNAEAARQRAENVREAIERLQVQHLRQPLSPVTASIGVACFPVDGASGSDLLRKADAALYRAKHEGRNRVVAG